MTSMKKTNFHQILIGALIAAVGASTSSCGLLGIGKKKGGGVDAQGEVVGQSKIEGRQGWGQIIPYGMVPIPAGTFHIGQDYEEPASKKINFNKQIKIGPKFIDDNES